MYQRASMSSGGSVDYGVLFNQTVSIAASVTYNTGVDATSGIYYVEAISGNFKGLSLIKNGSIIRSPLSTFISISVSSGKICVKNTHSSTNVSMPIYIYGTK